MVRLEVPGVARDDLDVSLDGKLPTLSGKQELHREENGEASCGRSAKRDGFVRTLRPPHADLVWPPQAPRRRRGPSM
jgi:HSP20 family molecular chaperone IbpA